MTGSRSSLTPNLLVVLSALAVLACSSSKPDAPPPVDPDEQPPVADGAVFKPIFTVPEREFRAGTAFVAVLPGAGEPVAISALSLMGQHGGVYRKQLEPRELGRIREVVLGGAFDGARRMSIGARVLPVLDAAAIGTPSVAGDVMAFWAPVDPTFQPLTLARTLPQEGERIWLAAALDQTAITDRLHPARFLEVDDAGEAIYDFDEVLKLNGTAGAPLLNARGEVVAIHLKDWRHRDQMSGAGNPVTRFGPALQRAAGLIR
ncbi:MAG: hypothetical protein AAF533_16265 [Acidobacteriota bacterium]